MNEVVADELYVSEIFGPTVQGEGPATGRRASFVRLGGCNLTCRDCDTPYTWDASRCDLRVEIKPVGLREILERVDGVPLVVISGGEPLLHQRRPAFGLLVSALAARGQAVHVETNGTIAPSEGLMGGQVQFVVSPKLAGAMSIDAEALRIVPAVLEVFGSLARAGRADFKFVCAQPGDVYAAAGHADRFGVPRERVWIMPEGRDAAAVLDRGAQLADTAIGAGFNVSTRLHLLLWPGEDRGR